MELLVETVCSTKKYIRVAGSDYPAEVVRSRLLKLDMEHIIIIRTVHFRYKQSGYVYDRLYRNLFNRDFFLNKLIKKIVIHKNEKKHSHNNVKVDIYFTAVDLFTVPQEQELLQMMEEIRKEKEISLKTG